MGFVLVQCQTFLLEAVVFLVQLLLLLQRFVQINLGFENTRLVFASCLLNLLIIYTLLKQQHFLLLSEHPQLRLKQLNLLVNVINKILDPVLLLVLLLRILINLLINLLLLLRAERKLEFNLLLIFLQPDPFIVQPLLFRINTDLFTLFIRLHLLNLAIL